MCTWIILMIHQIYLIMKETSMDISGSKSISSVMFYPIEDTQQKRMDSIELSWMNFDVCQTCNDSKAIIFDAETNETVCSSCGIVLRDNVQGSPELRTRKYSQEDIESRSIFVLTYLHKENRPQDHKFRAIGVRGIIGRL